jgi:hypothetical protein
LECNIGQLAPKQFVSQPNTIGVDDITSTIVVIGFALVKQSLTSGVRKFINKYSPVPVARPLAKNCSANGSVSGNRHFAPLGEVDMIGVGRALRLAMATEEFRTSRFGLNTRASRQVDEPGSMIRGATFLIMRCVPVQFLRHKCLNATNRARNGKIDAGASSSAIASFRSSVSKPSVNQQ